MAFKNIVLAPFECGQKKKGVGSGSVELANMIKASSILNYTFKTVYPTDDVMQGYADLYKCLTEIKSVSEHKVMLLGGDHSIGQPSVASSMKKYGRDNLVVIWVDAHADTNTYDASMTKNLHGMPLAGIMGYEKMWFDFDETLPYSNLLYFGIRDVDKFEKTKISENKIFFTSALAEIIDYIDKMKFENSELKFHMSWDVDSLDPTIMDSTGCVVDNGLNLTDVVMLYEHIEKDLVALDVVEYNPELGNHNKSSETMKYFFRNICL